MEYLQDKEYFPFKIVIIDDSLQITLEEKKKRQVSFGIFLISLLVQLLFSTSWKLVIFLINILFEQERTSPKGANEPQTFDPFIEWVNFMFKYTNIYFKQ